MEQFTVSCVSWCRSPPRAGDREGGRNNPTDFASLCSSREALYLLPVLKTHAEARVRTRRVPVGRRYMDFASFARDRERQQRMREIPDAQEPRARPLHQVPDDRKHRLDPVQVAPVVPARVGHAEEAVLLKEVLRRVSVIFPTPQERSRRAQSRSPASAVFPRTTIYSGARAAPPGQGPPDAHPDEVGRDSRFPVLPEDALHRIDQEEPLPSEEPRFSRRDSPSSPSSQKRFSASPPESGAIARRCRVS